MAATEYDQSTKLYHMGARYYDPELGRFLSEDPIGIAGGLNLYAYAGNDPINRTDRSGLDECAQTPAPMASAADTITLPPVVVCGDQGDGTPGPPPACAYFDTCGGNPLSFPPPDDPNYPIYQPPGGGAPPPVPQPSIDEQKCSDAKKMLALSIGLDLGFLATGGAAAILRGGRAAAYGIRSIAGVGRMSGVYARGNLVIAGKELLRATAGRTGVAFSAGATGIAQGVNDPGSLWSWSGLGNLLLNSLPIIGTVRAYNDYLAACGG